MTEVDPTFGDSNKKPSLAEAPDQTIDREAAIEDLRNLFEGATTLPLPELVPGYQEGRLASYDSSDPYITRNEKDGEGYVAYPGYKDVTAFRAPAYAREKPGGPTRIAILLHDAPSSTEGQMVEKYTGQKVEGGIVDFDDKPWMSGNDSWPHHRYVFVRNENNNVDVLKLSGFLASNEAEALLLKRILNDNHTDPAVIDEVIGSKIKPASAEEIREIEEKIRQQIAAYPDRVAKKLELNAEIAGDIAHEKTLRGKLGKLARRASRKSD